MSGWKSRYDRAGQTNIEKYFGRKLHVQDNFWGMAKVVFVIFIIVLLYVLFSEFDFRSIVGFFRYLA